MSAVFDIKPGDLLFEFASTAEILTPDIWLDEKRRLVNDLEPKDMELATARALAFDRKFTKTVLMPEHDDAGFIQSIDAEKLEALVKQELEDRI